jgi:hypothetical protein
MATLMNCKYAINSNIRRLGSQGLKKQTNKRRGFSPQANYTDRAAADYKQ